MIVLDGMTYPIKEVIVYRKKNEAWVNLVVCNANGKELAVEAVQGEEVLTLWKELPISRGRIIIPTAPTAGSPFRYGGETFSFEEQGRARAIVKTQQGTEDATVPYQVFRSESRRIAIETWDGKPSYYIAEETPPQVSF